MQRRNAIEKHDFERFLLGCGTHNIFAEYMLGRRRDLELMSPEC